MTIKKNHNYYLFSKVTKVDWSFISQTQEKATTFNCSFFFSSSPVISSTVYPSQSITNVWQVPDGLRGENNVLWPSAPPCSSAPGSHSCSQQAVGGPRGPSSPPPPPESIALRHHTNDPLKSMHHSTVHHQQWPAVCFRRERESERDGEFVRVNLKKRNMQEKEEEERDVQAK